MPDPEQVAREIYDYIESEERLGGIDEDAEIIVAILRRHYGREEELRRALGTALRQWRGYYGDCNSEDLEKGKHPEAHLYLHCVSVLNNTANPANDAELNRTLLDAALHPKGLTA